jgi:hypothetical protein
MDRLIYFVNHGEIRILEETYGDVIFCVHLHLLNQNQILAYFFYLEKNRVGL